MIVVLEVSGVTDRRHGTDPILTALATRALQTTDYGRKMPDGVTMTVKVVAVDPTAGAPFVRTGS